jgi:ATP synthase protein I
MKEETKKLLRQAGWATTLGFQVVFAIFIGLGIGVWLDSNFSTFPWLTLVFLVMGVIASFLNFYRFIKKHQRDEEKGLGS